MRTWFGVDIGGTTVKTALVSELGTILHKTSFATHPEEGAERLCERIGHILDASLAEISLPRAEILGVGVGVPAFLDDTQRIVLEAVNLGWKNVSLAAQLEERLGVPAVLENDANLAALGEAWVGAGKGAKGVLCVTVGTGVGGGIVLDGQLYRGVGGMAGEIGHLTVQREHGYLCNCGKTGCLETMASASAFVRQAQVLQQQGDLPQNIQISGAKDVFDLGEQGSVAAQSLIAQAADWLGYGLALAAITLNPDAIVIGGGVSKAGNRYLEAVEAAFSRYALRKTAADATIRLAELGNDAGVIGAARLIAQRYSQ